jgi:predicted AlkP superfamily phosphohydrolase/phosphomutase
MVLVVLGIDALDPELVGQGDYPNLELAAHRTIETIDSTAGEPSTHELWPTIITGLTPPEHGITLDEDGVAWGNPLLDVGSRLADYVLPDALQTRIGAWLLTNTAADAFRTPATYYQEREIDTMFTGIDATPIGIPNYVVDPSETDREHELRQNMGTLFERDPEARGGHRSSDPMAFYEQCLEMVMIRIARARRVLRGGTAELVFAYTSGLDLVGHIAYDNPGLQQRAYEELDEFVGELRADLDEGDKLLLVSDHGLQDGVHTHEAMVAATDARLVADIESVLDVRTAIETELDSHDHEPEPVELEQTDSVQGEAVREQLEDLGYM